MPLTFSQFGEYNVFAVSGKLTISELPHVAPELNRHVQAGTGRHLALDLSGVEIVDSSALRLLVNLKKHADAVRADFVIIAPTPAVLDVLTKTNLDKVFRILGGVTELEAMIADEYIRKYTQYSVDQDGLRRLSLTCAVCGSNYVTGYLVDQSQYRWEWKTAALFPHACALASGQPFDVHALVPVACTECFMCSTDIARFNVVDGEHVVIHSSLDDTAKSMLGKSIKKRKKLIEDLGVTAGERFFEWPREQVSSYGIFLLAESCAQTMAARKSTADAFGIGWLNYLASKYASAERMHTVLGDSRTWLTLALSERQSCTPLHVAQAYFILIVASLGIDKVKDAAKLHAEFETFVKDRPVPAAPGINDIMFWYQQAHALWSNQIENSAAAFKAA